MGYPITRMRRFRRTESLRSMLRETDLRPDRFILPVFVRPGRNVRKAVRSMPGVFQLSVDRAVKEAKEAWNLGIRAVILFGIPSVKDEYGSEAYDEKGIVPTAIRALKDKCPGLVVVADTCFCEYTRHGHCGIVKRGMGGWELDNDATLELLAKEAVTQAQAGADIIAPSGMLDGMVKNLRQALDENGFQERIILSYAAKFASAFYGPFREAAEGAPRFGDRRSYQMDPGNAEEALREVALDIQEGADAVMVKPALAYLDVVRRVKDRFNVPLAAYNVSGEYAMVKAAGANGWLDGGRTMLEVLTSIRRAGADWILTYHAKEAAKLLG